jgi:protease-4
MKIADVDSIAQGRVWTGARASTIGLVDSIGGLDEAIKYAAKSVGLKEFKLKKYPEPQSMIEYFVNQYSREFTSVNLEKELGMGDYQLLKRIKQIKAETGEVKAMLPFEFTIR